MSKTEKRVGGLRAAFFSYAVFSPCALASFARRSSNVQKRSALSSRAQATCRLSSVRIPKRWPCRWASSRQRENAFSGMAISNQKLAARSASNSRKSRSESEGCIRPRNTCCNGVGPFREVKGSERKPGPRNAPACPPLPSADPAHTAKHIGSCRSRRSITSPLLNDNVGAGQHAVAEDRFTAGGEVGPRCVRRLRLFVRGDDAADQLGAIPQFNGLAGAARLSAAWCRGVAAC